MDIQPPPEDPLEGTQPSKRDPLDDFNPRLTGFSEVESFLQKTRRTLFAPLFISVLKRPAVRNPNRE
jgi:hypothetical protein